MHNPIEVSFYGGPSEVASFTMSGNRCEQRIGILPDSVFVKAGPNIAVARLEKGEHPKDHPHWQLYKMDVYEKDGPSKNGKASYHFVETVTIRRCVAKTKEGEDCKNEAWGEALMCKLHMGRLGAARRGEYHE